MFCVCKQYWVKRNVSYMWPLVIHACFIQPSPNLRTFITCLCLTGHQQSTAACKHNAALYPSTCAYNTSKHGRWAHDVFLWQNQLGGLFLRHWPLCPDLCNRLKMPSKRITLQNHRNGIRTCIDASASALNPFGLCSIKAIAIFILGPGVLLQGSGPCKGCIGQNRWQSLINWNNICTENNLPEKNPEPTCHLFVVTNCLDQGAFNFHLWTAQLLCRKVWSYDRDHQDQSSTTNDLHLDCFPQ